MIADCRLNNSVNKKQGVRMIKVSVVGAKGRMARMWSKQ